MPPMILELITSRNQVGTEGSPREDIIDDDRDAHDHIHLKLGGSTTGILSEAQPQTDPDLTRCGILVTVHGYQKQGVSIYPHQLIKVGMREKLLRDVTLRGADHQDEREIAQCMSLTRHSSVMLICIYICGLCLWFLFLLNAMTVGVSKCSS